MCAGGSVDIIDFIEQLTPESLSENIFTFNQERSLKYFNSSSWKNPLKNAILVRLKAKIMPTDEPSVEVAAPPEAVKAPEVAQTADTVAPTDPEKEAAVQKVDELLEERVDVAKDAAKTAAEATAGKPEEAVPSPTETTATDASSPEAPPPAPASSPEAAGFMDKISAHFDAAKARSGSALTAGLETFVFALSTGGAGLLDWLKKTWGKMPWSKTGDASATPLVVPNLPEQTSTPKSSFTDSMKALAEEFSLSITGDPKKDFILVATELGKEIQAEYGIPYQVVVAQTCLESAYGASGLTQKYLACFGVKASGSYSGERASGQATQEYVGGQLVDTKDDFRAYPSLRDSFVDYAKLLRNSPRYAEAFKHPDDPRAFLTAVIEGGYAGEDRVKNGKVDEYVDSAESFIRPYGLSLA